jgi:predicted kinase
VPTVNRVLFLTGTCGSGKSTVAGLLALKAGWDRIAEDELWHARFGKKRGAFGSEEHRGKRREIQTTVLDRALASLSSGRSVVIDATIHESPPEAFLEYRALLESRNVPWSVRILQPRLDVAIARDSRRGGWRAGAELIADLRAKFTGAVFPAEWFLDTSSEGPAETVDRVLASGA